MLCADVYTYLYNCSYAVKGLGLQKASMQNAKRKGTQWWLQVFTGTGIAGVKS